MTVFNARDSKRYKTTENINKTLSPTYNGNFPVVQWDRTAITNPNKIILSTVINPLNFPFYSSLPPSPYPLPIHKPLTSLFLHHRKYSFFPTYTALNTFYCFPDLYCYGFLQPDISYQSPTQSCKKTASTQAMLVGHKTFWGTCLTINFAIIMHLTFASNCEVLNCKKGGKTDNSGSKYIYVNICY